MGKDTLADLLIGFATLIAFNWAATESLPRMFPRIRLTKPLLAVLIGMISGPIAVYVQLVSIGNAEGAKAYVAGAFIGIIGTVLSGAMHDYVIKPAAGGQGSP